TRHEQDLQRPARAQTDAIAIDQRVLRHALPIDKRAGAGLTIPEEVVIAGPHDFGVLPRDGDVGAQTGQVRGAPTADGEDRLLEEEDTTPLRIVDPQTGVRHRPSIEGTKRLRFWHAPRQTSYGRPATAE